MNSDLNLGRLAAYFKSFGERLAAEYPITAPTDRPAWVAHAAEQVRNEIDRIERERNQAVSPRSSPGTESASSPLLLRLRLRLGLRPRRDVIEATQTVPTFAFTDEQRRDFRYIAITRALDSLREARRVPGEQTSHEGFMMPVPVPQRGSKYAPRDQWVWPSPPTDPRARGGVSGNSDWRELEHLVAQIMQQNGHVDAAVRQGSRDGGIDVESSSAVAQVKRQVATVGRPLIQQLYGAAQHSGKIAEFYTTSSYSKDAVEFATQVGARLFVVDEKTERVSRVI